MEAPKLNFKEYAPGVKDQVFKVINKNAISESNVQNLIKGLNQVNSALGTPDIFTQEKFEVWNRGVELLKNTGTSVGETPRVEREQSRNEVGSDTAGAALPKSISPSERPVGWMKRYGDRARAENPFAIHAALSAKERNIGAQKASNANSQFKGRTTATLSERFATLKERLAEAWFWQKDDLVREFVASLSDDEQRQLTMQQENDLVSELVIGRGVTESDRSAVRALYSTATSDPSTQELDQERHDRLASAIAADDRITRARAVWNRLDSSSRLEVLQHVADVAAEEYGLERKTLTTFSKERKDGLLKYGDAEATKMRIRINNHDDAMKEFFKCINTIVHETQHLYQYSLARDFDSGRIARGDPGYEQARAFWLSQKYIVPGSVDYWAYRNSPGEREAWEAGRTVVAAIRMTNRWNNPR